MRNKSKKPLGGVFHGHDWCPKNPITKRINFCKIDICEKDPQVPKKRGLESEK